MTLAALLLAACIPIRTCASPSDTGCATPTPTISWNQNAEANLAGYALSYDMPGGVLQLLKQFPCEWYDLDLDGTLETRFCRGPDLGIPLQRYCPSCTALNTYEFAVKAYDILGNYSTSYSNVISVCFPPIYPGRPAAYQ